MVTLKYSIAADQAAEEQNWKKINNLCFSAIQEFEAFCELLKDPNGNMPDTLSEDTVKPYIVSQIYIARLYGKFRPQDAKQRLAFLHKAEGHFQKALDYYEGNEAQCRGLDIEEEMNVAREMAHFLPIKMEKIRVTMV